jgi:hypothetical protein
VAKNDKKIKILLVTPFNPVHHHSKMSNQEVGSTGSQAGGTGLRISNIIRDGGRQTKRQPMASGSRAKTGTRA